MLQPQVSFKPETGSGFTNSQGVGINRAASHLPKFNSGKHTIQFDIVVNKYYNCIQKGLQLWIYFVFPNLN